MEKDRRLLMSGDEVKRLRILHMVKDKKMTQNEAARRLNKSLRQVRRLFASFKAFGDKSVIHGLVGKVGNKKSSVEKIDLILKLWKEKYQEADLNFTHFTEKLNEIEKVKVSRETVRVLLRKNNLSSVKIKKSKKHRSHRKRRECFGELLQQDTSPHDWLGIGVTHHLVVIIDDATSTLLSVKLFESDGTFPNMNCMKEVFEKHGLPMAIYTDRASWFHYSGQGDKVHTHKANRVKKDVRTQIGRALDQLGVELIPAYSAQAKGRVERSNRTLQDRLISELHLVGIKSLKEANEFIKYVFIPDHNKRFAITASNVENTFVKLVSPKILNEILCLEFFSKVQNDNTVSKSKYYHLQLLRTKERAHWVQAKVKVLILLDGSVSVYHATSGEKIPFKVLSLTIPKEFKHGNIDEIKEDISILRKSRKLGHF